MFITCFSNSSFEKWNNVFVNYVVITFDLLKGRNDKNAKL